MGIRKICLRFVVICGVSIASAAAAQTPERLPVRTTTGAPCSIADEPYVTTCLVSVAYVETVAGPIPLPPTMAPDVALKIAIEQACGSGIRNVMVSLFDGNQATVHLTARGEVQARQFWDIIQQLPELRGYCLDVKVTLKEGPSD